MTTESRSNVAFTPTPAGTRAWTEHLGTAFTLGYLALIAVGMFHNVLLYPRFRINILDFAEPSDLLLAVATVVPIVLVGWYLKASERIGERIRQRRRAAGVPIAWWESKEKHVDLVRQQLIWVRGVTILRWVVASGARYERRAADRIMVGDGDRVVVETTGNVKEEAMATRPVMLLGVHLPLSHG